MLIVLDTCNIAVSKNPEGGFMLRLSGIEGFPADNTVLLPVAEQSANALHDAISKILNKPQIHLPTEQDYNMSKIKETRHDHY